MDEIIKSFGNAWKDAPFDTLLFWGIPVFTIILIWLLTTVGLKIFNHKKLKTVFLINKASIVSSLAVAAVVVAITCYCWSQNVFAQHPYQMALLISLIIALSIPVIAFMNLRQYYSSENMKEIIDQPKTGRQLEIKISIIKKAFRRIKIYYILPLAGFLFLLFYFNKGTNLISIVFDNSGSMMDTVNNVNHAMEALSETFEALEETNEIVLTTLGGLSQTTSSKAKQNMAELMSVRQSSGLIAGTVRLFNTPLEAKNSLYSIVSEYVFGSPISESIWKTWLTVKETKAGHTYRTRFLIIITDGFDNLIGASLASGNFFFDNDDFSEYFVPENTFVIDYSGGTVNDFLRRCVDAGCDVYPAENSKEDYLEALDNALRSVKNNWALIWLLILIVVVFSITGILIHPPKKII
jgi:hypothetical protein